MLFGECDSELVIGVKGGCIQSDAKNLQDNLSKPKCFLRCVSSGNVFALGGG